MRIRTELEEILPRGEELAFLYETEDLIPLKQEYRIVKIPKGKGKYRTLFIPCENLKRVQRIVNSRILRKVWKNERLALRYGLYEPRIYGLYSGSNVTHAREHENSRWIFQFDIKDAFPSVKIDKLEEILYREFLKSMTKFYLDVEHCQSELDYLREAEKEDDNPLLWWAEGRLDYAGRKIISSPFYQLFGLPEGKLGAEGIARELANLIIEITTYQNILPQGTPTAPLLFYIYLKEQLVEIMPEWEQLLHSQRFEISCYVDGFVISSHKPISLEIREKALEIFTEKSGFEINDGKIKYQDCRQGAVMVAGLIVDGTGEVRIPQKTVRSWRGKIHRAAASKDPELIRRAEGFMGYSRFVYRGNIPPQLTKPYSLL